MYQFEILFAIIYATSDMSIKCQESNPTLRTFQEYKNVYMTSIYKHYTVP